MLSSCIYINFYSFSSKIGFFRYERVCAYICVCKSERKTLSCWANNTYLLNITLKMNNISVENQASSNNNVQGTSIGTQYAFALNLKIIFLMLRNIYPSVYNTQYRNKPRVGCKLLLHLTISFYKQMSDY